MLAVRTATRRAHHRSRSAPRCDQRDTARPPRKLAQCHSLCAGPRAQAALGMGKRGVWRPLWFPPCRHLVSRKTPLLLEATTQPWASCPLSVTHELSPSGGGSRPPALSAHHAALSSAACPHLTYRSPRRVSHCRCPILLGKGGAWGGDQGQEEKPKEARIATAATAHGPCPQRCRTAEPEPGHVGD